MPRSGSARALEADSFWPTAGQWAAVVDAELGGPSRTGDGVATSGSARWTRAEALPAQVSPYLRLRLAMAQHAAGIAVRVGRHS